MSTYHLRRFILFVCISLSAVLFGIASTSWRAVVFIPALSVDSRAHKIAPTPLYSPILPPGLPPVLPPGATAEAQ